MAPRFGDFAEADAHWSQNKRTKKRKWQLFTDSTNGGKEREKL
jgi:hypothetical protein